MRDFLKDCAREMLDLVIKAFTPICLEETGASIEAYRSVDENGVPFLSGLRQEVTTHIEARQACPRKNETLLSYFFAQLIKYLAYLAVAPTEFVCLLIAI